MVLGNALAALGLVTVTPQVIPGLEAVPTVVMGSFHACVVRTDGGVQCWGSNLRGQLGDGTSDDRRPPGGTVLGLTRPASISSGANHVCAVAADERVYCWGHNNGSPDIFVGARGHRRDPSSDEKLAARAVTDPQLAVRAKWGYQRLSAASRPSGLRPSLREPGPRRPSLPEGEDAARA